MAGYAILGPIRTLTLAEKLFVVRLKESGTTNEIISSTLNTQVGSVERALRLRQKLEKVTTKASKRNLVDLGDKLRVLHFLTKDFTV